MSVKTQHPDYIEMLNKWSRCSTVAAGQDAVHQGGTVYLPRLTEQNAEEYDSYKARTTFYNATWRTIVGLQGMLYRKPPKIVVPTLCQPMLEDITLSGTNLHIFSLEIVEECLKLGRVGIFVDYPDVGEELTTQADAASQNLRPLFKMYPAITIINWKKRLINNASKLSMIVLQECMQVAIDEFKSNDQIQYRVLDLEDIGEINPVYRVRVFIVVVNDKGLEEDKLISTSYPKINGKYLNDIPFQFIGVDDVDCDVDEPPLIDLVDMNLAHYRVSADYEHGCHFTGLPTPIVCGTRGIDDQGVQQKYSIGSSTAWVFQDSQTKVYFLEFTGQGLNALEKNLERKEAQMAILGARMLENSAPGVESANTAAIHRGGEQSMLSSVAQAVSIGITRALAIFCKFTGEKNTDSVKFDLNRDFFPIPMDALTLTAIIAGWQNGAYSFEQMFTSLQRGEVIDLEATVVQEKALIAAYPSPIMQAASASGVQVSASASRKGPRTAAGTTGKAKTISQQQKGN